MNFTGNPNYQHGSRARVGLILLNLGTPDAPTAGAVRRYLAEFLSDRRVVEIPALVWKIILHGIILRVRPAKSAKKYQSVWTDQGSPLKWHSQQQAQLLQGVLGERLKAKGLASDTVLVKLGMRYGEPKIPKVIAELQAAGCDKLLILPLYPQYAASTTATGNDAVFEVLRTQRYQMALRTVASYHADSGYIAALAEQVRSYWAKHSKPAHFVMSFHGVPERSLHLGDPYHCFCLITGRLLAQALQLKAGEYSLCFQSRFGRAKWLQPYTSEVITRLGQQKISRLDVFCPGFPADCLETLEEIAQEAKHDFQTAGGGEFNYIPALNSSGPWINALADVAMSNLHGWLQAAASSTEQQASQTAAKALGAKQ
jgi:protoporphyrin/coproporphyrin ferrochelatase